MSVFNRREIFVVLTFVTGFLTITDYFVVVPIINDVVKTLISWTVLLAYFAIVLGLVNIVFFHTKRLTRRQPQMIYSAWLLIILVGITLLGVTQGTNHFLYQFFFTNVYTPLGIAGYGIMTFFIASAAFRALRARTLESMLLVLSLIFIVLYNAPVGALVPIIPQIGFWIQSVPSNSGMRGIIIGMAIGALGIGLRTLIGRERGYLPE